MNELTWEQFCQTPIIGKKEGKYIIKHGDEIVTLVKNISRIIGMLYIPGEGKVDFHGCSEDYVREKIMLAIADMKWLKDRVKEIEKESK